MARFAFLFALAFFMGFALLKNWKRPFFISLAFMIVISAYFYATMKHIEDEVKTVPTIKSIETVRILYGSDKKMLFNDPEFQEMLKKNYGIVPDGTKLENSDITSETVRGYDGVWLSKHTDIKEQKASEDIFQTREVLYSWHEIANALMRQGIVEKKGERYVIVRAEKLRELEQRGQTWESIGLSGRYEKIRVLSADADTGDLFDRYIKQGELSYPLIAAPENLIIEWYQTQPAYREKIRKEIVILEYELPKIEPHSFIALTAQGKKLLSVLKKPEVRQFVSRKYGFRFGSGELDKQAADALGLLPALNN